MKHKTKERIENKPTTNKTRVLEHLLLVLFLAPQISKRVDNNTKYQVQNNNDDHEEEQQVVYDATHEHVLLHGGPSEDVPDAPSISEPLIQSGDYAHYQGITGAFLDGVLCLGACFGKREGAVAVLSSRACLWWGGR